MTTGVDQLLSLDDQIASINALNTSPQQHKRERFRELYEAIERALERKTPVKVLRAHLRQLGLELSVGTFHKLLEAERTQRAERGDPIRCEHCGALSLVPTGHDAPAHGTDVANDLLEQDQGDRSPIAAAPEAPNPR